jgi:acetyl-CoA carboxylase beta subunit
MKISNVPVSLKKINGKSTIALNWSKNKSQDDTTKYFSQHIVVINLKSEKWWKKPLNNDVIYTKEILAGIYFINKFFCRRYITLTENNKSNSVIDSKNIHKMLDHSISRGLYIQLPDPNKKIKFNILKAFDI